MRSEEAKAGPYRVVTRLEKWEEGRTAADGEPDAVLEQSTWHEPGGKEIQDPARIAQLEALYPSLEEADEADEADAEEEEEE